MRRYEVVYIVEPEKSEELVAKIAEEVKAFIEKEGGTVEHIEQWGKKKLAYTVKKQKYGWYTLFHCTAPSEMIAKLEQSFNYNESIIKYITLRFDERSAVKPPVEDTVYYDRDNRR